MERKIITSVFILIGGAILAAALYGFFFRTKGENGLGKGVLWIASDRVESAISNYYYRNCYIPSVHQNDSIDLELGLKVTGYSPAGYNTDDLYKTSAKDGAVENYGSSSFLYTTGWR